MELKERLLHSYRTRYKGSEYINSEMFYNSVLSDLPITWIDRLQIKTDCNFINLDCSFFHGLKSKHNYQSGLISEYQLPFFHVKTGYSGKHKYLYLDLLCIPLSREIKQSFIDLFMHLLQFQIIKNNRKSEDGFRKEAKIIFNKCIVNEIELRTDICFDNGGKKLLNILGAYDDDSGRINISSWEHRNKSGYLVKAYERNNFARIEVVLYRSNFDLPINHILGKPENVISYCSNKSIGVIDKLSQQKPALRKVKVFIEKTTTLENRCNELNIKSIAKEMMQKGQIENVF
jgi:hypothetical protein